MGINFKEKKVLVMGLGLHGGGVSITNWLLRRRARVRVTDVKTRKELLPSIKKIKSKKAVFVLGRHRKEDFLWADMVIRNPAVPNDSSYLRIARDHGADIENEATLFFQLVGPDRIIGITGTRGKSTTAALIYKLLKRQYSKTLLGGNIGTSHMFDIIDKAQKETGKVVLELSSWHLENLSEKRLNPHIAVVTNLLPDHLDRYETLEEYYTAKTHIARSQLMDDYTVLNADDRNGLKFFDGLSSKIYFFSLKKRVMRGVFAQQGNIFFKKDERPQRVMSIAGMVHKGRHFLENALAAITVAKILGVDNQMIRSVLKKPFALSGRAQVVRRFHGVTYINDTTATTPDACMAALRTLRSREGRKNIILISGGSDKKIPQSKFNELARVIQRCCKAVIIFQGKGSVKIKKGLKSIGDRLSVTDGVTSMTVACAIAKSISLQGDIILLSPACASFGLFVHEFDRGEQFCKAIFI